MLTRSPLAVIRQGVKVAGGRDTIKGVRQCFPLEPVPSSMIPAIDCALGIGSSDRLQRPIQLEVRAIVEAGRLAKGKSNSLVVQVCWSRCWLADGVKY